MTPPNTGFPRASRILKPSDFLKVKEGGVRSRSGKVTAAYRQGPCARLGLVVTRRTGNSVQRNKIKRIAREFFRREREKFPAGDFVLIFAPSAGALPNEEIRRMIRNSLERLAKSIGSG
jgi:ribonuclease P protein component